MSDNAIKKVMEVLMKEEEKRKQKMKELQQTQRNIPVADIFYSIQGEGFNVGIPSVFIRFAGCNLSCPWCDSWWAVEKQILLGEYKDNETEAKELMKYLIHRAGFYVTGKANIVFTGGEPTLYQDFICKMITQLPNVYDDIKKDVPPYIDSKDKFLSSVTFEMETNGIIFPEKLINVLTNPIVRITPVDVPRFVFEISPKLTDNIMNYTMYKKVVDNIIRMKEVEKSTENNIAFICKFVTDGRPEEIDQIYQFIEDTKLSRRKVFLMPKCSIEEARNYVHISRIVADICLQNYWRFSPREQVVLYGNFRSK